ncbi:hypothetical protein C4568_03590 [Candidatus Parcubacteria bacterium]|nr:MAG: hypothetical protein C4568_03590 [Candidatus Parcubacteria bacterium]
MPVSVQSPPILAVSGEPQFTEAPTHAPVSPKTGPGEDLLASGYLEALARDTARRNGLNEELFIKTLECESAGWQNIQSQIPGNGPNNREDSWGVSQIHLPSHPEITREQALDPEFAIAWMAEEWVKGNEWKWTCYRKMNPG